MKDVQVKQGLWKEVSTKELTKSIKEVSKTDKPVGFVGTLSNGLKFIVKKGIVLLF